MRPGIVLTVAGAALAWAAPAAGASDTIDGKKLFASSCGWCHQDGGRRAGRGPKLAGSTRDDSFIAHRIRTGKQGAMPAFGNTFDDAQVAAIVAYIRGMEERKP